MKVDIFHASPELFPESIMPGFAPHRALTAFEDGRYQLVGSINATATAAPAALDEVYRDSQNLDAPWSDPPRRSTSMGDVLRIDNDLYMVSMFGFVPL